MIGQKPITAADFATPTTDVGRLCAMFYPRVRDSLLRKFPWQFAAKRISLMGSDIQQPISDILNETCAAVTGWTDGDSGNGRSVLDTDHWKFDMSAAGGWAHRYKTLSWPEWGTTKFSTLIDLKLGDLKFLANECFARFTVIFGQVALSVVFTKKGINVRNHDGTYTFASECSYDNGLTLSAAARAVYTFDVSGTYVAESEDGVTLPYGAGLVDIYKDDVLMNAGIEYTYAPHSSWLAQSGTVTYAAPTVSLPVCSVALNSLSTIVTIPEMLVYGIKVGTSMKSSPSYGFAFAYPLPQDHMRTVAIDSPNYDFVLEDQRIMTDAPSIGLNYIGQVTDTDLFPDDFKDALVSRLAAKLAIPVTQQPDLLAQLYKVHGLDMQEAHKIQPAFKQEIPGKVTDTWISARR
jgi:hypothetical protein